MSPLFHDRFGKLSPEDGELVLELLLRRRETALAQAQLLIKRAEIRGQDFLLFREAARHMRPRRLLEFLNPPGEGRLNK